MRPPVDDEGAKCIKAMAREGASVRTIAAALDLSKSAVQRVLKPVPPQNIGEGHSGRRHARESMHIAGHTLPFGRRTNRETLRQAAKVLALAKACPERYGDIAVSMKRSGARVWPHYQEAIARRELYDAIDAAAKDGKGANGRMRRRRTA